MAIGPQGIPVIPSEVKQQADEFERRIDEELVKPHFQGPRRVEVRGEFGTISGKVRAELTRRYVMAGWKSVSFNEVEHGFHVDMIVFGR